MRLINAYRMDDTNCGDKNCSPVDYFNELKDFERVDLKDLNSSDYQNCFVILGGGGNFLPNWIPHIEELINNNIVVVWGAGTNTVGIKLMHPRNLAKAQLIGLRDYDTGYDWLPCASCMHPVFDTSVVPKNEVVVYEHKKYPLHLENYPVMTNAEPDIYNVIEFLGSAKRVITNSYHGVYWSLLLQKKTSIVDVRDRNKLYYFPFTLFKESTHNGEKFYESEKFLSICREHNKAFAAKVLELIADYGRRCTK